MSDKKPLPPDLPTGTRTGEPLTNLPSGAIPTDALPELPREGPPVLPGGAISAEGLPELPKDGLPPLPTGEIRFKEMPRMDAGPYIKRTLKLLKGNMGIVGISFVLSLIR